MSIADYTTTVDVTKTLLEIHDMLVLHNAKSIIVDHDNDGNPVALMFKLVTKYGEIPIKLPVDINSTKDTLEYDGLPPRYHTKEHAKRVAWRITRDWIRAQLGYIDTGMVKFEQVFLPFITIPNGISLFDTVAEKKFYLGDGR